MPAPDPNATEHETKREAFFAALPDPPANVVTALAEDHPADQEDAGETPTPKASPKAVASAAVGSSRPAKTADEAPIADRIVAAAKAGDLDLLADLTDQDPASFDEKTTKWAARNRKEAKLKDEVTKVRADAAAVVAHYEPLDAKVAEFHSTKNYALVKDIFELLLGEDFDSAAMKTFRAVRAQDPRVPVLTKQLAAKDEELTTYQSAKEKAQQKAVIEALHEDLAEDHTVRKIPGWEDKVFAVLKASTDEDTGEPSLSFKQAAQRVLREAKAQYEQYAGAFGGGAPADRPSRAKTPERADGAAGGTKRKLTREEFFASQASK